MRSIHRIITAAVLVIALAMPAIAASRPSPRSGNLFEAVKRFIIRAMTRISPPGGNPDAGTDEPTTTTTDEPGRTQTSQ